VRGLEKKHKEREEGRRKRREERKRELDWYVLQLTLSRIASQERQGEIKSLQRRRQILQKRRGKKREATGEGDSSRTDLF